MTEPHTWLVMSLGVGDTRLPIVASARVDGTVELAVGDPGVHEYETVIAPDELSELIDVLTMVRDAAEAVSND